MDGSDLDVLSGVLRRAQRFGHREHVELAYRYLRRYPVPRAADAMASAISHLAREHGEPQRFHVTLTRAWVHLVAVHMERWGAPTFDEFIAANPELLDRTLLNGHFSAATMGSDAARREWVAPDLRELPVLASDPAV